MIIGVNVRLLDGTVVVVVPSHVVAVAEERTQLGEAGIVAPHPVLYLTTGARYDCAPVEAPLGMPQSVALINAINGAIGRVIDRVERHNAIAGGLPR